MKIEIESLDISKNKKLYAHYSCKHDGHCLQGCFLEWKKNKCKKCRISRYQLTTSSSPEDPDLTSGRCYKCGHVSLLSEKAVFKDPTTNFLSKIEIQDRGKVKTMYRFIFTHDKDSYSQIGQRDTQGAMTILWKRIAINILND